MREVQLLLEQLRQHIDDLGEGFDLRVAAKVWQVLDRLHPDHHVGVLAQVQHRVDGLLAQVGEVREKPSDELGAEPLALIVPLDAEQDLLVLGTVSLQGFVG
jgi:hypothetical protein